MKTTALTDITTFSASLYYYKILINLEKFKRHTLVQHLI